MNKIYMQYPLDITGTNELYDGEVHEIIPQSLYQVNVYGNEFYIMEYFDYTSNTTAVTLLMRINNLLVKVPLDEYDSLIQYMNNNNLTRIDITKFNFPQNIKLAQTINAQSLFKEPNKEDKQSNKPNEFTWEQFVPVNINGIQNIPGTVFESDCIIISPTDEETYRFCKSTSYPLKDQKIEEGLKNYYINENGVKCYDFSINVQPGTIGRKLVITPDNKIKVVELYLIPGIHHYKIFYSDFILREDYNATKYSETMEIYTTWPKQLDQHDRDKAFVEAGQKKLEMVFYDTKGKIISHNELEKYRR